MQKHQSFKEFLVETRGKRHNYVGIKKSGDYVHVRVPHDADVETHGKGMGFIGMIGPFRTAKGAKIMAKYGKGNPHIQHVDDAERFARNPEKYDMSVEDEENFMPYRHHVEDEEEHDNHDEAKNKHDDEHKEDRDEKEDREDHDDEDHDEDDSEIHEEPVDADEEDPNHQGVIRTIDNAHLIYKRKENDGTYSELWIYMIGDGVNDEMKVRRAILAGTDIPQNKIMSSDRSQQYELWTIGNVQFLQVTGLPD